MLRNRFERRLAILEARFAPPCKGTSLSTEALAASLAQYQAEDPPDLVAEVEALERRRRQLEAEVKGISA